MEAGVVSLGGEAALLSMPGNPGSARQKASRRPPVNMNESLAACSSARAKSAPLRSKPHHTFRRGLNKI